MYVIQTHVKGEDFIGLFGIATDRYALLSKNFPKIKKEVLEVPIIRTWLYGTNLIGIFAAGNSNGLLLPYFTSNDEIKKIDKGIKDKGYEIRMGRIGDKYTAIGNLIASNDKGAVVSPKLSNPKHIEDILGVEVVRREIGGHEEAGAYCVATNKGFLVCGDAENELKDIEGIFKVPGMAGSVNFGVPFVRSGLIANSNGYITGMAATGIELGRIDDALGFI